MPKVNPEKILVLCLSVDQVLINTKTLPYTLVDFNRSNEYDDASVWLSFIKKMQQQCANYGIQFVVQIITSKIVGQPDKALDRVAKFFSSVLVELMFNGTLMPSKFPTLEISGLGVIPARYYAKSYMQGERPKLEIYDNGEDSYLRIFSPIADESDIVFPIDLNLRGSWYYECLPAIHTCYNNHPVTGLSSKACVMQLISHFFNGIPPKNMFLLDNDNALDINNCAEGLTPIYQYVSAKELEYLSTDSKENRTLACQRILSELESRFLARLLEIGNPRSIVHAFLKRYDRQANRSNIDRNRVGVPSSYFFTSVNERTVRISHDRARSIFVNREAFVQCFGNLLKNICREQDLLWRIFLFEPSAAITIQNYVKRLVRYMRENEDQLHDTYESTFVIMLIYLDRFLMRNPMATLNSFNSHRVVLACLQLAHKMNDDECMSDQSIANLGLVTKCDLKILEQQLLHTLQYDLHVSREQFEDYYSLLSAYQASFDNPVSSHSIR